jgi:hypothetical protein
MQLGDKVFITGGVEEDWIINEKPYYLSTAIKNKVVQAYEDKEVCKVSEIEVQKDVKVFNLMTNQGEKLSGFYEWELENVPVEMNRNYYIDSESGLKCFDENGLTYVEEPESGIFYPNIVMEESEQSLSKWGMMRLNYIKDHKTVLWSELTLTMKLYQHCLDVQEEALEMHQQLLEKRIEHYRHLQSEDYFTYLQTLNNMVNQVDEIVASELIYV